MLGEKVLEASGMTKPVEDPTLRFQTTTLSFPNRADQNLTVEVEIACLQIDSIVMGFWPGEPYMEFQLRLREALKDKIALLVGYTNDSVCYIPPKEEFAHGGYGVDFYHNDPPQYSRTILPKGAGEQMLEALIAKTPVTSVGTSFDKSKSTFSCVPYSSVLRNTTSVIVGGVTSTLPLFSVVKVKKNSPNRLPSVIDLKGKDNEF